MKYVLILAALFMTACAGMPVAPVAPTERIVLSWESTNAPHPERKPWSDKMTDLVEKNIETFDLAKDITLFCPKYAGLTKRQKINGVSEFLVAMTYFESSYNPESKSVDVGTADNKDTWSVGLFQLSVVDQPNYKLNFGYKFDDLMKAEPNITLAIAIMTRQINKRGLIVVPSSPYWAVIYRGKYDKIDSIIERLKTRAPFCF